MKILKNWTQWIIASLVLTGSHALYAQSGDPMDADEESIDQANPNNVTQSYVWADISIAKILQYGENQYLGDYVIRVKNLGAMAISTGYVVEITDTVPKDLFVRNRTPQLNGPSGAGPWRCRRTPKWSNKQDLTPDWQVGSSKGQRRFVCRLINKSSVAPGESFPPLRLSWEGVDATKNAVSTKLFVKSNSSSGLSLVSETNLKNNKAVAKEVVGTFELIKKQLTPSCVAGQPGWQPICEFEITLKNKTKSAFTGPIHISDVYEVQPSVKFLWPLTGFSGTTAGWNCVENSITSSIECNHPGLTVSAGGAESITIGVHAIGPEAHQNCAELIAPTLGLSPACIPVK